MTNNNNGRDPRVTPPKSEKTMLGIGVQQNRIGADAPQVPQRSGRTILGVPAPSGPQTAGAMPGAPRTLLGVAVAPHLDAKPAGPMVGAEPSVQVEVLHVEDRLSLDDRWSTEPSAPGQPAPVEAPKASTRTAVAGPAREAPVSEGDLPTYVDDSPIRPAGVPRWSFGKILFFLALLGGAGTAAYVERQAILTYVSPYFEDVGIRLPTSARAAPAATESASAAQPVQSASSHAAH